MATKDKFLMLVDAPDGLQYLLTQGDGASYFDPSRVLWDERTDGDFPSSQLINVGGLIRVGGALQLDVAKLTAYQTTISAQAADATLKKQQARDALQEIRDFDEQTATAAQVRQWQRNVKRVLTYVFKSI